MEHWKIGTRYTAHKTYRFFQLNLINLDAEQFVSELVVKGKLVRIFHITALGKFAQYSGLATSQRLQCSAQLGFFYQSFLANCFEIVLIIIVEQKQNQCLEKRYLQFFDSLLMKHS